MNRLPILIRIATVLLLFALIGTCKMLTGCTTIQKVFSKHTAKTDSTVIHRTDSLAYRQKTVKEGHQLSVRFDTGCTNTFTINPTTGIIQATGGVAGVSFTGTKEGKEVDSVRVQKQQDTRYIKETVLKEYSKTKKVIPWWVYVVVGLAALIAVYSLVHKLNPIKKFYPFILIAAFVSCTPNKKVVSEYHYTPLKEGRQDCKHLVVHKTAMWCNGEACNTATCVNCGKQWKTF